MTSLPSFVELMASLGLENSADPNDMQSLSRHSRTSSYSSTSSTHSQSSSNYSQALECYRHRSPSIVISSSSPTIAEMEPEKRRHRARFSPYSPAIVRPLPPFTAILLLNLIIIVAYQTRQLTIGCAARGSREPTVTGKRYRNYP